MRFYRINMVLKPPPAPSHKVLKESAKPNLQRSAGRQVSIFQAPQLVLEGRCLLLLLLQLRAQELDLALAVLQLASDLPHLSSPASFSLGQGSSCLRRCGVAYGLRCACLHNDGKPECNLCQNCLIFLYSYESQPTSRQDHSKITHCSLLVAKCRSESRIAASFSVDDTLQTRLLHR